MKRLRKCVNDKCGTYTLSQICPLCKSKTKSPHPAKFSPEDPYGEYRRKLKKEVGWDRW